jgi:hypothetical protein
MKTVLFIFLLCQFQAFSQCDTSSTVDFPDIDAQFPGGIVEMKKFIQENIEYPPITRYDCFPDQGRLYFEFIVCDNGKIQNIQLLRPSNSEFVQMAIDLLEKMPNWIPAEMNHQAVSSKCRLPITICLQ